MLPKIHSPVRSTTPVALPVEYSDSDSQSVEETNGSRAEDENAVPDVKTKPDRRKKHPKVESGQKGEKGTKPEKKKEKVKDS